MSLLSRRELKAYQEEKARLEAEAAKAHSEAKKDYLGPQANRLLDRLAYRWLSKVVAASVTIAIVCLVVAGLVEALRGQPDVYVTTQNGLVSQIAPSQISK